MATSFEDILRLTQQPELTSQERGRQFSRGLAGLSAALLEAGAPRTGGRPSTLGGIGKGLLGFQQGLQASQDDITKQRMRRLQLGAQLATAKAGFEASQAQTAARRQTTASRTAFSKRAKDFMSLVPEGTFDEITRGQLEASAASGDVSAFNAGLNSFRREAGTDKRQALQLAFNESKFARAERGRGERAGLDRETRTKIAALNTTGADARQVRRDDAALQRLGFTARARTADIVRKIEAQKVETAAKERGEKFKSANVLRDDLFRQKKEVGFDEATTGIGKVREAARLDTGVGDMSLIFGYMKVLDPTSVVRESEFALAENTAGLPARVRNFVEKIRRGVRLTPQQRRDFIQGAEALYRPISNANEQIEGRFRGIADRAQINFEDVLSGPSAVSAGETTTAPPPGFSVVR